MYLLNKYIIVNFKCTVNGKFAMRFGGKAPYGLFIAVLLSVCFDNGWKCRCSLL